MSDIADESIEFFGVSEDIGWVIGWYDGGFAPRNRLAPFFSYFNGLANEPFKGDRSESTDDGWAYDFYLALQKRPACFNFLRQWASIVGRPAFYYICYENIITSDADSIEYPIKQFS